MKTTRFTSLLAAGALAAGALVSFAGAANAAPGDDLGPISLTPSSGNQGSLIEFNTPSGVKCPAGTASVWVYLTGSGMTVDNPGIITGNTDYAQVNTPTNVKVPAGFTPASVFSDAGVSTPSGDIVFNLQCLDADFGDLGTFRATTTWTPTGGNFNGTYVTQAPPATPTSTTLTQSANSSTAGSPVTFTADTTDGVAGSIQFKDGAANLGSAVAVNATGGAVLTTSALPVGARTITAVFTPSVAGFDPSTSAPVTHTVSAAPAQATTTTVAATPGTGAANSAQTLTATVAPAAAGTVSFSSNVAGPLGSVLTDASGVAALSTTALGGGAHTITASFAPANPAAFNASSGTTTVTLDAAQYTPDVQSITAEIPAGTLVITTPYHAANPLNVGNLVLDTVNYDKYVGTATFNDIQVTDARGGAQPWTLSAISSALTKGSDSINSQNIGLTNLVRDAFGIHAGTINASDNAAANPPVAPGVAGNAGLGGAPHTVLHALNGPGTVKYHGTLTVTAPSSTPAGLYTGTITFTIA